MRLFTFVAAVAMVFGLRVQADDRIQYWETLAFSLEGVPPDFAQEFETYYTLKDGAIEVPLIGSVRAQGLTRAELAARIETRLREGKFFTRPVVTFRWFCIHYYVGVGGAVRNPRGVCWEEGMTLTKALAVAAGPMDSSEDKVRLKRGNQVQEFSLKALKKDPAGDPKVFPRDVVEMAGEF